MSFNSYTFLLFLGVTALVYYMLPAKCRSWVILAANLVFYFSWGVEKLIFFMATTIVVYISGILIGRQYDEMNAIIEENGLKGKEKSALTAQYRKTCKRYLLAAVVILIAALCYCKYTDMITELISSIRGGAQDISVKIIVPLGISYYTFSSIGYLLDIYWRKKTYERNYLNLLTCMSFFPQIVQGPITRYPKLLDQMNDLKGFDYDRFCRALQLMLWGYFKKLVIADRILVVVNQVFDHMAYYRGLVFVVAIMASAVWLYADFSGCMDIVQGIAELFGIELEKNFEEPFSAKSTAEFWRRWHITLGAWFKDYVFFPLSISSLNIRFSKFFKAHFGNRAGRAAAVTLPLFVVWLLTGVWHGTGLNYVVWGLYYGLIIILSTIFQPEFTKLTDKLHIDTKSRGWECFCMARTFLIFCGGRLLTVPGTLENTSIVIRRTLSLWNPWIFFDGTLFDLGLNEPNVWLLVVSMAIMGYVGHLHVNGVHIREQIEKRHIVIRWAIYLTAVFAVLIFGMYGAGYTASDFIYAGF